MWNLDNGKLKSKGYSTKCVKKGDVYYTNDKNAVGILKYDGFEMYLGIFNLSNEKKKIHWKFAKRNNKDMKGLGEDIFTGTLFFINEGEVTIDSLMPNDCYIIKISNGI